MLQLGAPTEISNNSNSLYVAGFIDSPAMNLIHGDLKDGVFESDGYSILRIPSP